MQTEPILIGSGAMQELQNRVERVETRVVEVVEKVVKEMAEKEGGGGAEWFEITRGMAEIVGVVEEATVIAWANSKKQVSYTFVEEFEVQTQNLEHPNDSSRKG